MLVKNARSSSFLTEASKRRGDESSKIPYRVNTGLGKVPKASSRRIWVLRMSRFWSSMGLSIRHGRRTSASETRRCGTVNDLTGEQCALWYAWLKKTRPLSSQRPRATWAQLLRAFGLLDISGLIKTELLDADCAPSSLDVPLQRVRLGHLGYLALVLGMKDVQINTTQRDFLASGPFGRITTENVPSYGKTLRFEGNILKLCAKVNRCSVYWLSSCATLITGKFTIGWIKSCGSHFSVSVFLTGLLERWDPAEFERRMHTFTWADQDPSRITGVTCHFQMEATAAKHLMEDVNSQGETVHSTAQAPRDSEVMNAQERRGQNCSIHF